MRLHPIRPVLLPLAALLLLGVTEAQACSLSAWSRTVVTGATRLAAAGPLHAEPSPRYSGRCAAIARAPGNYVVDESPNAESRVTARFYVMVQAGVGTARVFQAIDAGGATLVSVSLESGRFVLANGAGASSAVPAAARVGAWYAIDLAWSAAEGASMRVQGGGASGIAPVTVASGSTTARVDAVNLGWVSGQGSGAVVVDAYDAQRLSSPGRLCRGDANADLRRDASDVAAVRGEILGAGLAQGQPDCNEDGRISAADMVCVRNAERSGRTSCANTADF